MNEAQIARMKAQFEERKAEIAARAKLPVQEADGSAGGYLVPVAFEACLVEQLREQHGVLLKLNPEGGGRLRCLRMTPEFFLGMFTAGVRPGYEVIEDALPEDAELVRIQYCVWPNWIEIVIRSASFEPVAEGAEIPRLVPVLATRP